MEIVIQLWHQNFISILFTHKIGEVKTKLADLVEAQRTTKPVCLALLDEKGKSVGSVLVEVSETKDVDAGNLALEQAHKAVTEAGLEHAPDVPSDDTMDRLAQLADKLKSFITILDTASEVCLSLSLGSFYRLVLTSDCSCILLLAWRGRLSPQS